MDQLTNRDKELVKEINRLITSDTKFRVTANGHAAVYDSPMAKSNVLFDIKNYTNPLNDSDLVRTTNGKYYLTASTGYLLADVRDFLSKYNLRLFGVTETETVTLGGGIVMGAHDGSLRYKCLANYVKKMYFVDGLGKVRIVSDRQKIKKMVINYGLIGVLFKVVIECFEAKNQIYENRRFGKIESIDEIIPKTHSLLFGPYSRYVIKAERIDTDLQQTNSLYIMLWNITRTIVSNNFVAGLVDSLFYQFPQLGIITSEFSLFEPNRILGKFDYFTPTPKYPIYTLEYGLDIKDLMPCYKDVQELITQYRQRNYYISYRFWCRFIGKDDLLNSIAYKRDTVVMETSITRNMKHVDNFIRDINKIYIKYNGRPHLGKTIVGTEALTSYDYTILREMRRKYDPNNIFENEFIDKIF